MKIFKKALLLVPAMVLAASLFAVPVFARNGVDDNTSDTSTIADTPANEQEAETSTNEQEQTHETAQKQAVHLREQAKLSVEKQRKQLNKDSEKHKQDREKKCESHKQGLETKVASLNKNAQKHLDHFNSAYVKALQFQKDNNLNPTGFADLVTTADAAQAKAVVSVEALNMLKPTVDCNSDSTASDVAAFKAGATQARTDLNAYRAAVKAVFKSLVDAKHPANETESENQ